MEFYTQQNIFFTKNVIYVKKVKNTIAGASKMEVEKNKSII